MKYSKNENNIPKKCFWQKFDILINKKLGQLPVPVQSLTMR
jgi:hypothetical protein